MCRCDRQGSLGRAAVSGCAAQLPATEKSMIQIKLDRFCATFHAAARYIPSEDIPLLATG